MLPDDRTLLDGFRAASPTALRIVYEHYAPRLTAFLRGGFTFSSAGRSFRFHGYQRSFDLETAVQEVFARAFSERARLAYDGLHPYVDYLFAIARNYTLNELRRHEAQVSPVSDLADELEEPRPTPEVSAEEREVHRLLAAFLDGLEARDRAYFAARFTEERNQADAARALGITRIRARRMEARIKRDLLQYMKDHGYLAAAPAALAGALVGNKA